MEQLIENEYAEDIYCYVTLCSPIRFFYSVPKKR